MFNTAATMQRRTDCSCTSASIRSTAPRSSTKLLVEHFLYTCTTEVSLPQTGTRGTLDMRGVKFLGNLGGKFSFGLGIGVAVVVERTAAGAIELPARAQAYVRLKLVDLKVENL